MKIELLDMADERITKLVEEYQTAHTLMIQARESGDKDRETKHHQEAIRALSEARRLLK